MGCMFQFRCWRHRTNSSLFLLCLVMIVFCNFFYLHGIYLFSLKKRQQGLFRHDLDATAAPPDRVSDADIMLIKNVCSTIPPGKYADWTKRPTYYVANNLHLSYCVVQHEMDNFWKDVFHVLLHANSDSNSYDDLIGLYDFEMNLREKVPFTSILRRRSQTVLFTRNPYVRLFAAFFDRFYVIHHTCEKIDFQEYLDLVISGIKLHLGWGTHLMPPLVPKCAICNVRLFQVIREEVFLKDFTHMLNRLKLKQVAKNTLLGLLKNPVSKQMITSILHAKVKLQFIEKCPKLTFELVPRLWQSLQNMGLISASQQYPKELETVDVSKNLTSLVDAVLVANKIAPMTEKDRMAQRSRSLVKAYADIKLETIEYIKEVFKYDFEMFGYSKKKPGT